MIEVRRDSYILMNSPYAWSWFLGSRTFSCILCYEEDVNFIEERCDAMVEMCGRVGGIVNKDAGYTLNKDLLGNLISRMIRDWISSKA